MSEADRLERLWAGGFGDDYVARNSSRYDERAPFWDSMLRRYPTRRALEVGCNVGGNLRWMLRHLDEPFVCGIDVNMTALSQLRGSLPAVGACRSLARQLPFRDQSFDLVFTMGVLIHQPEDTLAAVMAEMVRTSRRYVLCGEYFGEAAEAIPYRGQEGALFRRDYGKHFEQLFPQLSLVEQGFLGREHGWDDVTFWVLQKR
jgi:pseudaminic acid biosynthesis-associated methylase